jgi:D-apionolactonase
VRTAPSSPEVISIGPIAATLSSGSLRWIQWHGIEVLHSVEMSVRDATWGTVALEVRDLTVARGASAALISIAGAYRAGDMNLEVEAQIEISSAGSISFRMDAIARHMFLRNRIGLVVLFPVAVAGHSMDLTIGSEVQAARFPLRIEPDVVATDLSDLRWSPAAGISAEVSFLGERWEMEDQRNWTDASFKAYPTPLVLPYPVEVQQGTVINQEVRLHLAGAPSRPHSTRSSRRPATIEISNRRIAPLPAVGAALAQGRRIPSDDTIHRLQSLRLGHLRAAIDLRLHPMEDLEFVINVARRLRVPVELDIVISGGAPHADPADLAARLGQSGVAICGAFAFDAGSTTTFDSSDDAIAVVRRAFAGVRLDVPIGGGTRGNFTELNRARLKVAGLDQVTFSLNPQVHAFDEDSMVETLEVLPAIVRQARTIARRRPLSVIVSLKPRPLNNPGPREPSPAGRDLEILPAWCDARQPTLFAAAWTVGALAGLSGGGIGRVTFYDAVGMAGLLAPNEDIFPSAFPAAPGDDFPVAHVMAAITEFGRAEELEVRSSSGFAALHLRGHGHSRLLIANLCSERRELRIAGLPRSPRISLLEPVARTTSGGSRRASWSFLAHPDWRLKAGNLDMEVGPWGIVEADWPRAPSADNAG